MDMSDENLDDVISSLIDIDDSDDEQAPQPQMPQPSDKPISDQPVILTPRAARQIGRIRESENLDSELFLRVAVEGGGCSGLNYKLGFDVRNSDDVDVESEGVAIVVDPRHLMYLDGIQIDYPDGLDARGFTFDNPNATDNCGCGASFAI